MIQLENVTKTYASDEGPVHALDGVSLSIDAGEFVAIKGHSGSGKSTLLTIVGALNSPTSGTVTVDGRDLSGLSAGDRTRFRAETIGFVFQMFHLVPYLSVLDNVLVPTLSGAPTKGSARATELLDRFQLSHRLTHRPEQLSTGERQRVAIARALLNEPKIILADEPTGNLDPDNAKEVMDLIADFNQAGGTVMVVTHEDLTAGYASRTVELENGQVKSPAESASSAT